METHLEMLVSDFQTNLHQKPDVLGRGPITGMHEGKYSQSVLQEAKINALGWLVLVQAGAKAEEH